VKENPRPWLGVLCFNLSDDRHPSQGEGLSDDEVTKVNIGNSDGIQLNREV